MSNENDNQNQNGGENSNENNENSSGIEIEKRTIEVERDVITVRTDLDVPSSYPALPIFAGQGWIYASVVEQQPESQTYLIADKDTGATLKFTPHWERSDRLPNNHRHNDRRANSTFEVGDFLVDHQFTYDGDPRLQVRIHPDITDPDPKVVVEGLDQEADR